jgi:hypothetical protein
VLNVKNRPNFNNNFSLCKILEIIKTKLPNLIITFNNETFSYTNINNSNYLNINVDTILNYDGIVEPTFNYLSLCQEEITPVTEPRNLSQKYNKKYKIIKNNF